METKPLVVIVGPTASGKTSLAIDIAERVDGEIICADSRTVYKHMDIGTAKPSSAERARVPHWGLDLVDPDQRFNVANFKDYAEQKIAEIRSRDHVPILVGGTGLYIDAILFDYQFGIEADEGIRQMLNSMSLDELHKYCINNNIKLPENYKNKRYVIRAIEQKEINNRSRIAPIENTIIVGITTDKDDLRKRIEHRSEQIFADGVVNEAKMLGDIYGWGHESMTGNIYPLCKKYIDGQLSLEEIKQKFVTLDWRLAKRQLTWLRRNPYIMWLPLDSARNVLLDKLAPEH